MKTLLAALLVLALPLSVAADQLVLLDNGHSDYQVVVPDESANPRVGQLLRETAELVRAAFAANGAEVPVVAEADRDPARPAIFLGETRFAAGAGVDTADFTGWEYVQRTVGHDLVITGRDAPHPLDPAGEDRSLGVRLATLKGTADFLREHAGVRFLYPYGENGVEYLPTPVIMAPAGLDRHVRPILRFNFFSRLGGRGVTSLNAHLYLVANNYFPNIDFVQQPHSYDRAVPVARYRESNPEYFALIGGRRTVEFLPPNRQGAYCVSNPEVRELIYQDVLEHLDRGYDYAVLGQQDGFQPCECQECHDLYGTGNDWGEKLWLFHRELAERLSTDRPGKSLICLIYSTTREPPQSFRRLPDNMMLRARIRDVDVLEPWRGVEVPGGIFGATGIWGAYFAFGHTPKITPLYASYLVGQYHGAGLKGFYLDGFGSMFGMEGPAYYAFGRLFDDPENLALADVLEEYYEAAFREAQAPMRRFFDVLHGALQFQNDMPMSFVDEYGRQRSYGQGGVLQRMRTTYRPEVLADLAASLGQAEELARAPKVKSRLALIRLELEYLRHIAVVAHLYGAWQVAPGYGTRDRLLDALDARNEFIDTLFRERVAGWPEFRLFAGHSHGHVTAPRGYRGSVFTWDTAAMRRAPLPGARRIDARLAAAPVAPGAAAWDEAPAAELATLPGETAAVPATSVRVIADPERLHLRVECELPGASGDFPATLGQDDAAAQECLEIVLDPFGDRERFYRFVVGPAPSARYAGATGLIDDPLHPLHGREDPGWTGEWSYESRLDPEHSRWQATISVPYAALDAEPPAPGTTWRGNFGRTHLFATEQALRAAWSTAPGTGAVSDRDAFGEIAFGAPPALSPVEAAREHQRRRRIYLYEASFEIPAEWRDLPNQLSEPWQNWRFRVDPADRGMSEAWFAPGYDDREWLPIEVPAFWRETEVADYLGTGWYRVGFELPEAWQGRPVRLSFGSVDGEAWIYVNGNLVRERTEAAENARIEELWEAPFEVEVPAEHLRYGGINLLAVRVEKRIGNAGIWRPVVLHALDR